MISCKDKRSWTGGPASFVMWSTTNVIYTSPGLNPCLPREMSVYVYDTVLDFNYDLRFFFNFMTLHQLLALRNIEL